MKRIVFVLALSLVVGVASAAAAKKAQPTVRLRVSARTLGLGQLLRMRGSLPAAAGGQSISIVSRPCGFEGKAEVVRVTVRHDGTFVFAAEPMLTTTFSVLWNNVASSDVTVTVQPAIAVTALPNGRIGVQVTTTGGYSIDGREVLVQRLRPGRTAWQTLAAVQVKNVSLPDAMTWVSTGSVSRAGLGPHDQVRALLTRDQAGPCYEPVASAPLAGA